MTTLNNFTYDEIEIGQSASYTRTLTERDVVLFAAVSGDVNPVHLDADFAKDTMFGERIGHGMWTGAIVSAALALVLPGPGCIYLSQSLRFRRPVKLGDTVTVKLSVADKKDEKKVLVIDCDCVNQNGESVAKGTAEILAPATKMSIPAPTLPEVTVAGL